MPLKLIKYQCVICGQEHDSFQDGLLCEAQGIPSGQLKEKSMITVRMEEYSLAGKVLLGGSYKLPILLAFVSLSPAGKHENAYIVEEKVGSMLIAERLVTWVATAGTGEFIAPLRGQFRPGTARTLREKIKGRDAERKNDCTAGM